MKIKKIAALALCLALVVTTVFAAEYKSGGEAYSKEQKLTLFTKLLGGKPASEPSANDEPGESGFVYVSADAFVLGGGYLLFPTKITYNSGDTASAAFIQAAGVNGVQADYDGGPTGDFYLHGLNGADFGLNIKPSLADWLRGVVTFYEPDNWVPGALREYDITDMSGWMFYVNGKSPDVGMGGYEVQDGDVIELRFSLAWGMDLGAETFGGVEAPYTELVDRSRVTRAIAEGKLSYASCAQVLTKADATQEEIDELLP